MNIKKSTLAALFMVAASAVLMAWEPAGNRIMTRWGKDVTPENVWQSYPRPQLRRSQWQNLNGLWECSVTGQDAAMANVPFEDEILVPFAIESSLSGIGKTFTPQDKLWYRRTFSVDPSWKGKNIILHFGAVDCSCEIFVNGRLVGKHVGGNNGFGIDITKALKPRGENTLVVAVTDPTDKTSCTRGKQILNPHGIWYTAVSGIWKTVWLEPVSSTSVRQILAVTDTKTGKVAFDVILDGAKGNEDIAVEVFDGDRQAAFYSGAVKEAAVIVENPVLWTPDSPKLYRTKVTLSRSGKVLDAFESYFAIREISKVKDIMGNVRFALNGEAVFQYGPLDQGWWPDGLLTPPSEEAMIYDMVQLKKMGFNTIRKHIKVEPELYYYYADSLGIMIWQDMPSGFETAKGQEQSIPARAVQDWDAPAEHEAQWKYEFGEMFSTLRFYPSVTTWVVFNEGWGQFRTAEMTEFVRSLDRERIINSVTGWADRNVGDVYDIHNYPSASMKLVDECGGRISSLGEFGGLGLAVPGHLWNEENGGGWGYRKMELGLDLMGDYSRLVYDLETLVSQGLSAAIYTQTTDVESEINGLMTYDREVTKLPVEYLHMIHSRLYRAKPAVYRTIVPRTDGGKIKEIAANSSATYDDSFSFDGKAANISLWIASGSTVRVFLNGTEIFGSPVRLTRNYNQYNITNYMNLLKAGDNKIRFEIRNAAPKRSTSFDYSITAF